MTYHSIAVYIFLHFAQNQKEEKLCKRTRIFNKRTDETNSNLYFKYPLHDRA